MLQIVVTCRPQYTQYHPANLEEYYDPKNAPSKLRSNFEYRKRHIVVIFRHELCL